VLLFFFPDLTAPQVDDAAVRGLTRPPRRRNERFPHLIEARLEGLQAFRPSTRSVADSDDLSASAMSSWHFFAIYTIYYFSAHFSIFIPLD